MENIGSLFDSISYRYDRFNHTASMGIDRLWRRRAVRSLPDCQLVLDVAAGTADLCIETIRQGKSQKVVGVDISEGMLDVGREKVLRKGLSDKIELRVADCASLPFDDNTFDAVTCGYGVRNFAELDRSLTEIFRVLKPGGQLRILEFTYPTNKLVRFFYDFYFTRIVPRIGKKLTDNGEAYIYFMKSVKSFAKGRDFIAILEKNGFSDTSFKSQTFGISTLYKACKR
ncbi:MAG: bifunctional demethylmenaquinone methyltransferase/2-methoxy-6-polyprenyl-1,4-benzoquinol methylase UbiE [Bacteroidales bacterium]|nr:bifunctional demethylmenaquinone methyltransferase/2-methoxy-6-polyprenyl-1,4-benzoquinol methylase UbiE [Bacteroidales bacterium]